MFDFGSLLGVLATPLLCASESIVSILSAESVVSFFLERVRFLTALRSGETAESEKLNLESFYTTVYESL